MNKHALTRILLAMVAFLTLVCVSCIERSEEITVDEDGNATIIATFDGNADDLRRLALPSEPEWTILSNVVDSNDIDNVSMKLEAELVVPYGTPLPETFAKPDAANRETALEFPTELKRWTENGRTFYEFKRTYMARAYSSYDITDYLSALGAWDQELEKRVLEKGIFEVSEDDRTNYLEQFALAYGYFHWRFMWETTAELYRRGSISADTKETVEIWAAEYVEIAVTPVRILGILGKDDDLIGIALDRLGDELHDEFVEHFTATVGEDQADVQQEFIDLFRLNTKTFDATEALGAHQFAISLELPGTIVRANGMIDPNKPSTVEWYFKGGDLHDKNIPLHALSVVEN
jgi:hypothetical protein